ncbi:MAG: hypothetical protein NW241_12820 [Bacteroidia bacterium]|nr:hypothetical protein [Bacteroidia bacterium]
MKSRFTDEAILRFLFDEMDAEESRRFLEAVCTDEELWERYESFQTIVEQIGALHYDPSERTVARILHYASTVRPEPVPETGLDMPELRTPPARPARPMKFRFSLNVLAVAASAMLVMAAAWHRAPAFMAAHQPVQGIAAPAPAAESALIWDDSALDLQLDEIRDGIESLKSRDVL